MIKSAHSTQFTREQMAGKANPSRNMTNRVTSEHETRKRLAIAKAKAKEAQKKS